MTSEIQNPIFFVCFKCGEASFEVPSYEQNKIFHRNCSKKAIEAVMIEGQKAGVYDPTMLPADIFIDDKFIVINHPYNEKLNATYQNYYGIVWDKVKRRRVVKKEKINTLSATFLMNGIQLIAPMYNWRRTDEVIEFLTAFNSEDPNKQNEVKKLNELKKDFEATTDVGHLKIEARPFQKAGIAFIEAANGVVLIGDEMGLGKSIMSIGYCSKYNYKTLVVTLASLKYNFKKEVEKVSSKKALIIENKKFTKEDFDKYDFFITNYEQVAKWLPILIKMKFDAVILDESQSISNGGAQKTKSTMKLYKIPRRILLSGTPSENKTIDLYTQLKFLKKNEFPNKQDFGMRYCGAAMGLNGYMEFKGSSNLKELHERMSSFYIRRLKKDVLKDLPEKQISNVVFEMNQSQMKEYKKLTGDFEKDLYASSNFFKKRAHLSELMQFCSKEKVSHVIDYVTNLLREDITNNKKVIVFSHFKATQAALKAHFGSLAVTHYSDQTIEDKNAAVERFQNNPDTRIFLGSTIGSGKGLNLEIADTVVFADLIWNPSKLKQAEDRAHRMTQKNSVFVYYFTFKDSIEEHIWATLVKKGIMVGKSIGDISIEAEDSEVEDNYVRDILNTIRESYKV
jgi:SNF2 family DNA or RNA helicase